MINSLVHHPCEVSLHLVSEDIFIHPPPPNSDYPGHDKTLSGLVEVRCPSERTIQGVKVTLQAIQTLAFPESGPSTPGGQSLRWEEKIIMNKTVEIDDDGTVSAHKHAKHTKHKGKGKARDDERGRGRHRDEPSSAPSSRPASPVGSMAALTIDETHGEHHENGAHHKAEGLHLEKGVHGFEFAFIIPATSAPYERFKNGRVRYIVTATALGAGRGRSNVSTWQEAFVILHVQPDGGPTPLDVQYHDVHEALGPMAVSLISASLTVGGTANLSVYHPDPPPGLSVHVVRVFLEQTIEMYSSVRKAWLKLPTEKLRLWEKGYMPYKKQSDPSIGPEHSIWIAEGEDVPGRPGEGARHGPSNISPFGLPISAASSVPSTPGEPATPGGTTRPHNSGYKLRAVVRLPDDNAIRPSTVRGCKTDIRVTHEIGVEVFFSRLSLLDTRENSESYGKPKVQVFSMRRAVCIPSCCCTYDTIHLPPYSLESPVNSRPPSPTGSHFSGPQSLPHSRKGSHADLEHWKATTTLNHTLPGMKRPSPNGSHAGSTNISRPGSRGGSRDSSPTRHGFLSGRKSRNSSPERAAPIPVRKSGLHALTPSHPSPLHSPVAHGSPMPALHHRNSMPADAPWSHAFFPSHTATSRHTCNCGRTTEELSEAEQRLLEGVPTAPGVWIDAHAEGDVPPPWFPPSRAGSPVQGWHTFASGNREGGRARGKLAEINTPYGSPH